MGLKGGGKNNVKADQERDGIFLLLFLPCDVSVTSFNPDTFTVYGTP